eukprot:3376304-Pyramimonas_sp.AAC.1
MTICVLSFALSPPPAKWVHNTRYNAAKGCPQHGGLVSPCRLRVDPAGGSRDRRGDDGAHRQVRAGGSFCVGFFGTSIHQDRSRAPLPRV